MSDYESSLSDGSRLEGLTYGLERQNLTEEMVQPETAAMEAGMWKKVGRGASYP
jgi:hypothetical protein